MNGVPAQARHVIIQAPGRVGFPDFRIVLGHLMGIIARASFHGCRKRHPPAPEKMAEPLTCPRCARPLPADAAVELCPACALEAALNLTPAPGHHATPRHATLRRKRLLHYQLLEKIGEGGMGVVYKARDTRLDRLVAIKILPRDKVSDPARRRRFIQEAKAASALNHPNIVTIHEVAAAAGVHFIVMEFVEGRTLDKLVRPHGLPPEQVLLYAIPIAGALARAHEAGIVHRDLKPQNIMVRDDGLVKLLDFGLAKLVEGVAVRPLRPDPDRARTRPRTSRRVGSSGLQQRHASAILPTESSRMMGTPGFMAPEQIDGRRIDSRADIFAFGAVLYHALSGRKPYARESADASLAAILHDEPAALANAPAALAAIVTRCLRKDPGERFPNAAELQAALRNVTTAAAEEKPEPSIAVLPFDGLGGKADDDDFGEALAGEIITALARVPGLKVIGRTSSQLVRAEKLAPCAIGERLGVAHLLEGSVQRSEQELRIAARLVRAADGACLWAESYDRTPAEVFSIQNSIATAIAGRLRIAPRRRGPLILQPTDNLEAYHHYLLGRRAAELRTEAFMTTARSHFEQAVRLDPAFAHAHVALAEIWWFLGFWGHIAPREAMLHGVWSAFRALELDDTLADGHAVLALYRMLADFNWVEARRESDRALELDPASPEVRFHRILAVLMPEGRLDEACLETEELLRADPLSCRLRCWLALYLLFSRRPEAAINQCRQIIAQEPRYPISYQVLGFSLGFTGKRDEAMAAFAGFMERSGRSHHALSSMGWVFARAGRIEEARAMLAELHARTHHGFVPPMALAFVYLGLDELDAAIEWLERGIEARDLYAPMVGHLPLYDPLRRHPRYPALLRRMNLES